MMNAPATAEKRDIIFPEGYHLRPSAATDANYEALFRLARAVLPDYPRTPEEMRLGDARRDPRCEQASWFVETNKGVMAGAARWEQSSETYHPRKFEIDYFVVHPEHQRRGVGGALFEQVLADIAPADPLTLRAYVRDNRTEAVRFLQRRGFAEEMRYWWMRLPVASFDNAVFAPDVARVAKAGIVIKTFAELGAETSNDGAEATRRKLHRLMTELKNDVPSAGARTAVDYAVWAKRFDDPNYRADASFIAIEAQSGEWVGYSDLIAKPSENYLHTGLTGVRRAWRRNGIALALKLRAIEYARQVGAETVRTGNETRNVGMLAINDRLGFVRQCAWLNMALHFKTEEEQETAI